MIHLRKLINCYLCYVAYEEQTRKSRPWQQQLGVLLDMTAIEFKRRENKKMGNIFKFEFDKIGKSVDGKYFFEFKGLKMNTVEKSKCEETEKS